MRASVSVFITIVQLILFIGHYVVYKTFITYFNIQSSSSLWWVRVIFFILSISFILASILAFKYYGPVTRALYSASAIWLGTLYWLFLASVLAAIIFLLAKFLAPQADVSQVVMSIFVLAMFISAYGVWNSYQTKVREITVSLGNLPEQWRGRKAVLVSDTHLGNVRNLNFSKKIADLIAKQNPDIVLVPGDFYDGTPAEYEKLAQPFGQIKAPHGVYFAPGNHEEFGDKSPFLNGLRKAGIKVLDNELAIVDGLQIIGLDYATSASTENQNRILQSLNISRDVASILIKHSPSHIQSAEASGIDLQVSGHTHLGQVYPMRHITKSIFGKFHYGLNRLDKTQVMTTSGAGTWGPPQRVGTNSEIVVIKFQ